MESNYLTMTQAARLCPGAPHSSAIWRWCRKGIKSRAGQRLFLQHVRVGHKLFITEDSLTKFFKAIAEADRAHFNPDIADRPKPTDLPRPKPQCRDRSIAQAEIQLRTAGILR